MGTIVNILYARLDLDMNANLNAFYSGPQNIMIYTILQGFITALVIKEVVSILRYCIKHKHSVIEPNKLIIWTMVENWEDLFKVFCQLMNRHPLHQLPFNIRSEKIAFNKVARKRLFISALIALFIFGCDMALIVLAAPNREPQSAERMNRLTWGNIGDIPTITRENILTGSFSKSLILQSPPNDIEFTRQPSVSLERTDFRDFQQPLPNFEKDLDNKFLHCNSTEGWRIVCRIYCKKRFYQYKLRVDVRTRNLENSEYFLSTSNFSVSDIATNPIVNYKNEIERQFGIKVTNYTYQKAGNGEHFTMKTNKLPPQYLYKGTNNFTENDCENISSSCLRNVTCPDYRSCLLSHDAIASLFLSTIQIWTTKSRDYEFYYRRNRTERATQVSDIHGQVAISQRPYLPLYGTVSVYVVLQLISVLLIRFRNSSVSADMGLIAEVCGGKFWDHLANMSLPDIPLRFSYTEEDGIYEGRRKAHCGYLPGCIVKDIQEYLKQVDEDGIRKYSIAAECEISSFDLCNNEEA